MRSDQKEPKAEKPRDDRAVNMQELTVLVTFSNPKPNPMFTEEQHKATLFLRFSKPVPCAQCGRRRKLMWTQRWSFFVMLPSAKVHIPGTPVCTSHILAAAVLPPPEKKKKPKADLAAKSLMDKLRRGTTYDETT
jgi:hypothetical protein